MYYLDHKIFHKSSLYNLYIIYILYNVYYTSNTVYIPCDHAHLQEQNLQRLKSI